MRRNFRRGSAAEGDDAADQTDNGFPRGERPAGGGAAALLTRGRRRRRRRKDA